MARQVPQGIAGYNALQTIWNAMKVYVDGHGGKIDTIKLNSTPLTITDKAVNITNIPKAALASAVQTSLGKADTALQTETYKGTVTKVNNTSPDTNGNVTISIPAAVTESTVSGWGFTKNTGTVTGSSLTANQVVVGNGNSAIKNSGYTIATSVPSGALFTDTKNTAGSADTSSKIFLVGATSQAANLVTYSDDEVYVQDGELYNKSNIISDGSYQIKLSLDSYGNFNVGF